VLLVLPNSLSSLISLLAVNEAGAVFVPLNPSLATGERSRIEEIARPDFLIAEHGSSSLLPGAFVSRVECPGYEDAGLEDLKDLAAIIFTTGTTGSPKGVMMTESALLANALAVAGYLDLSPRDRSLVFLPLRYAYALSQVFSTLVAGGCLVLLRDLRYPMVALAAIAEHRVTGFGGVPITLTLLCRQLASSGASSDSLRYILSAGGCLTPALAQRVQRRFPSAALINNYGCTEIGPRATAVNYADYPDKIGSIGRPIPGVCVRVMRPDSSEAGVGETGEIVLSGPSLMKGYYRDPQATSAKISSYGFHTGDFAYADADGFLHYQGRNDDIFKSAGEKISTKEIEDVVLEHDAVAEAAVISMPDSILGAVPVAYAVMRSGMSCSDRELQMLCARRLSRNKVPRQIHFVDALRKTDTGKIQKHLLKQRG
jgi:acyl-CoA synthetase (AMP-forming)/AMP-acid ligase II